MTVQEKYLKIVDGTEQEIDEKQRKYENRKEHNNRIKDNCPMIP